VPRNNRRRSPSRDSGFTLVELLVVVVVLGIIIAIAIPLYLRFTQGAYTASVKADIHTMQLEEQNYSTTNTGTFASTRELITANPSLRLSSGSVAAIVWSSADGYCVGAANSKGRADSSAPFAGFGFPYQTFFFDSRTGTVSTALCSTPSGATPLDNSYIDDTGGH
jgi:prepilin-type N-terminal cleavage/methylation domain-containing protein